MCVTLYLNLYISDANSYSNLKSIQIFQVSRDLWTFTCAECVHAHVHINCTYTNNVNNFLEQRTSQFPHNSLSPPQIHLLTGNVYDCDICYTLSINEICKCVWQSVYNTQLRLKRLSPGWLFSLENWKVTRTLMAKCNWLYVSVHNCCSKKQKQEDKWKVATTTNFQTGDGNSNPPPHLTYIHTHFTVSLYV